MYFTLRILVIGVMIAQFLNRNYENVFFCILTLILLTMPSMIERNTCIDLPGTLEVIILLFIFAAEILGEVQAYYVNFRGWDTMLHTLNGFLCAAVGLSMVDLLNRNDRSSLHLSPLYVAIAAFCFSMTIGVLWEFFEFAMDQFVFRMDMQKDTVVNSIASVALDPTHSNRVVRIQDITDTIVVAGGRADLFGPWRLSGFGNHRYHERPVCQLYRCSLLFCHWLFLCEKPWKGTVCTQIYSTHP